MEGLYDREMTALAQLDAGRDPPDAGCPHELDENICLLCGQFICDAFLDPGPPKDGAGLEPYQLPASIDARLICRAVDLFGCLNTVQIRAYKKKIIMTTCLLYVCSRAHLLYFYEHFADYGVTTKDIIYGISVTEQLLPPAKNRFELDFKLHEMILSLIDRNEFTKAGVVVQLHPHLTRCYNKLRIKSILDACLYFVAPSGRPPPAAACVREAVLVSLLPDLFAGIFDGACDRAEGGDVTVAFPSGRLELRSRISGERFDHRRATVAAWRPLFEQEYRLSDGRVCRATRSVDDLADVWPTALINIMSQTNKKANVIHNYRSQPSVFNY